MISMIVGTIQKWIPLIHVLVLTIGTVLSLITAISRNDVSLYLPFISETGAYTPAKCIFSLFLILGSFIGCIMVFFNCIMISANHLNEIKNFYWINIFTCLVGVNSMFGLAGVAAFPMTTVFWAHLVAAAIYFVGSAVYFICITFITYKIHGKSNLLTLRYILSGAIVVLLILITFFFPIALKRWEEYNDIIPALKEPKHKGFTLIFISSVLEWAIVMIIIVFNLSFIKELQMHKIMITVCPEEHNRDSVAEDSPQGNGNPS